jgi:hypothetical protein
MSLANNYQYITKVLFISVWFASAAPLGLFISLLGILTDYLIEGILISKVYKIPNHISKDIAMPLLKLMKILPFVYICGCIAFVCNAYVDAADGNEL